MIQIALGDAEAVRAAQLMNFVKVDWNVPDRRTQLTQLFQIAALLTFAPTRPSLRFDNFARKFKLSLFLGILRTICF